MTPVHRKVIWSTRAASLYDELLGRGTVEAQHDARRLDERARQLAELGEMNNTPDAEGYRRLVVAGTLYVIVYRIRPRRELFIANIEHTSLGRAPTHDEG